MAYKQNIFTGIDQEIKTINLRSQESTQKKQELITKLDLIKQQIQTITKKISDQEILKFKAETLKEKQENLENLETQKNLITKDITLRISFLLLIQ